MRAYVIGDVHGQYTKLISLLQSASLIDQDLHWIGSDTTLWFIGDLVDRGPDGIEVIRLLMNLQRQASEAGDRVGVLLGNHEIMLLGAFRFGSQPTNWGGTFITDWRLAGGVETDLQRLSSAEATWLSNLPAIATIEDHLLIHADALFYASYGKSIEEVNASIRSILASSDTSTWNKLLDDFSEHKAFYESDPHADESSAFLVAAFLETFGSLPRLVHGHTPISSMTRQPVHRIKAPLVYAGRRCINVDGGLYLGGRGFVYSLPPANAW